MKGFRKLVMKMAHKFNKTIGDFSKALKKAWVFYRFIMKLAKGYAIIPMKNGKSYMGTFKGCKFGFDYKKLMFQDNFNRICTVDINEIQYF